MPLIPAPPMPTRCTRCRARRTIAHLARAVGVRSLAAHAHGLTGAPTVEHHAGRAVRRRRACPDARRPPGPSRSSRGRVAEQRHERRQHPVAGQLGVRRPAAPPPAVDDRLGVERLLAVAVRQRHVHRGQADRGRLGDGHRPGPAQHEVGGGVGQVHPLHVRHGDVAGRLAGVGPHVVLVGPVGVQHLRPRPRPAPGRRRDDGGVERCAPCEPPNTSRVGPSASRPKRSRASARRAARSSEVIGRRSGMPTHLRVPAAPVPGTAAATERREPGADLVGQARRGRSPRARRSACGRARRGRRAAPRTRRTRRRRPRRPLAAPRGSPTPRDSTRPGSASRSPLGLRGSGTGGISSSG